MASTTTSAMSTVRPVTSDHPRFAKWYEGVNRARVASASGNAENRRPESPEDRQPDVGDGEDQLGRGFVEVADEDPECREWIAPMETDEDR